MLDWWAVRKWVIIKFREPYWACVIHGQNIKIRRNQEKIFTKIAIVPIHLQSVEETRTFHHQTPDAAMSTHTTSPWNHFNLY